MSRYTLELRQLIETEGFELFDFQYNFFDENLKQDFQNLFIDYFYFREIGFETIGRFKKELKTKLNLIHHYYKEYYKTVQQVEIEEFMVTKDATDTFTRILEGEQNNNGTSSTNSNANSTSNSTDKFFDTPNSKVSLDNNIMANANLSNNDGQVISNETSNAQSNSTNRTVETTILHSKGDLGVTSSGFLIQGWRDVITNIYQMIFDECEELFLGIF